MFSYNFQVTLNNTIVLKFSFKGAIAAIMEVNSGFRLEHNCSLRSRFYDAKKIPPRCYINLE